jgi:hypothetical protein
MIEGPVIYTAGGYFRLDRPDETPLSIDVISHALGNLCRFTGHGEFYSVAEHSVLASHIVSPEYGLEALMHDAHECVAADLNSPFKAMLPDYKAAERDLSASVRRSFGLPVEMSAPVKAADLSMLALEKIHVLHCHDDWAVLDGISVPVIELPLWGPREAARQFLARFHTLFAERETS